MWQSVHLVGLTCTDSSVASPPLLLVQEYLRALPDVEPSAAKPQATPAATPAKEQEPEEAEEKEEGMEVDEDGSAKKKVDGRGGRGGWWGREKGGRGEEEEGMEVDEDGSAKKKVGCRRVEEGG